MATRMTPGKLKAGKRVLTDDKFCFLDDEWGAGEVFQYGHTLYGICTMDVYAKYLTGPLDRKVPIPDNVCDKRMEGKPEHWHLRHKAQFAPAKRLWCYHTNPLKSYNLYSFMYKTCNQFISCVGEYFGVKNIPRLPRDYKFHVFSIVTISATGARCLWKTTTKTKDKNGNPIRVSILAEIDGIDAVNFSWDEQLKIADEMGGGECTMTRKVVNTQVCELGAYAK